MTTPTPLPPPAPLPPARVTTPPAGDRRTRARSRQRRVLVIALVLLLVAGVGWAMIQAGNGQPSGAARYTTVAVTKGSVVQRVRATGTVAKVNEMSVRFPAAATVTELRAAVGDSVVAGDVLAVIDDTALRTKVLAAQAAVDAAVLSLHQAKQADEPARTPAKPQRRPTQQGSGGGSVAPPGPPALPEAPEPGVDLSPLEAARVEAAAAASVVAERTADANAAVEAMKVACRPVEPTPTPTPTATTEPTEPGDPGPGEPEETPTPTPTVDAEACRAAVERVTEAQAAVTDAQAAATLANAAIPDAAGGAGAALTGAVDQVRGWVEAVGRALDTWQRQVARAQAAPAGTDGGMPSLPAGNAGSGGGSSNPNRSAIVAAEVALSKARRELASAQEQVAAATMRAPMAGTLSALPWSLGSTAKDTDRAVVTAPGAVTVSLTIPSSAYLAVKPGQQATVRAPGGVEAVATVASKALVPNGMGAFPVTILASGSNADRLAGGSSASVEIDVSSATDVIVVPLSAVTRWGEEGTVRRLEGDDVVEVPVKLGSIGDTHAEVLEGVSVGQRLVVADATRPLPGLNFGGPG